MADRTRNAISITKQVIFIACFVAFLFLPNGTASAYEITTVDVEVRDDFVLEQTRSSLTVDPGESVTEYISVINRYSEEKEFKLEFESFRGTRDPELGPGGALQFIDINENDPLSLVQYIEPEISEFSLEFGEKIRIPVTISIPENAEPGGRYGAVLVSDEPSVLQEVDSGTGVTTISRAAFLFLVEVSGDVTRDGELADFHLEPEKKVYFKPQPITFSIVFDNTGNVHLAPHGEIAIKNSLGNIIEEFEVLPYFVLPDSIRVRQITWDHDTVQFGRYSAELELARGYGDHIDTADLSYWFIPIKLIVIVFGSLFLFILLLTIFLRNFKIQRK